MTRLRLLAVRAAVALALFAAPALSQSDGHAGPKFWLPERASSDALPVEIDRLFDLILWITGVTMVGVFGVMAFFLFKYRAKPDRKAFYTHGSHKVEILWTIVPALILLWLALVQADTWLDIKAPARMPRPADSTYIRVFAQQFQWNFRNAGADGRFERFDEEKYDADLATWRKEAEIEAQKYLARIERAKERGKTPEEIEKIKTRLPKPQKTEAQKKKEAEERKKQGLEPPEEEEVENLLLKPNALSDDYWSADDDDDFVKSGELVVPIDRPVLFDLRSVDVLHSFWLPHLRIKQDAVPGKPLPVWFRPTKLGVYEIACAELCGNNHTTMRSQMRVVTREEYDAYVKTESAKKEGKVNRRGTSQDVWRAWAAQDQDVAAARLR
jgi:heme/copper-type cytochrome/quinol oxidase subunit 2